MTSFTKGESQEQGAQTLGDALPKEIARVQEILGHYIAIGPAGMFGAAFIRQDLADAPPEFLDDIAGYFMTPRSRLSVVWNAFIDIASPPTK